MKKQLYTLLFLTLLLPNVSLQAKSSNSLVKDALKATWQIVKVVGGIAIMTGGVVLFTVPCCCACCCGLIPANDEPTEKDLQNVNKFRKIIGKDPLASLEEYKASVETNKGSNQCCMYCCAGTGLIAGVPTIYGGYRVAKSGVIGLSDMMNDDHDDKKTIILVN